MLGKKVSHEEYFPKISLAKISLRKKKLEYSQPRNILAQNIPGDKRIFFEGYSGLLYNRTASCLVAARERPRTGCRKMATYVRTKL